MGEKEQVKPLAPASHRILHIEEEDEALSVKPKKYRHRNCIKCCGCLIAMVLILAVIILVLALTVFHVKDPVLRMNSVKIEGLNLVLGSNLRPGANLTLIADVSVKNPNVASFKFDNATTNLYYDGRMVGEATTPPGIARAEKTVRMNVTMHVLVDELLSVPRLGSDLGAGSLPVSSYTRISGKVKMLNIIKKNVVVRMNCTMTVDMKSQSIQDQNCKRHVSL